MQKGTHKITVNLKSWMQFISINASKYLIKEFNGSIPKNVYTIMLGTFISPVYLKSNESVIDCFKDTLEVLTRMKGDVTILIKPHAISSPEIYEKVISNYSNSKIHITYLHPAVLAKISKVFISNYYSTTLSTAKCLGVPTIEYTETISKP